jgi:hypothetical protein
MSITALTAPLNHTIQDTVIDGVVHSFEPFVVPSDIPGRE